VLGFFCSDEEVGARCKPGPLGAAPCVYLSFSVVEPFEPPHAIEFNDTNAVVGVTKCPAIFQSFNLLV
jgi:hypothetical protein